MLTRDDVVQLLQLAQTHDGRTIGQADIYAFARVLEDFDLDDCRDGITAHYASGHTQRVTAGDIASWIRAKRQDQAMRDTLPRLRAEMPPIDPNLAKALRPMWQSVLDERPTKSGVVRHHIRWPKTRCSHCQASPGRPCTNDGNDRTTPHPTRVEREQPCNTCGATAGAACVEGGRELQDVHIGRCNAAPPHGSSAPHGSAAPTETRTA